MSAPSRKLSVRLMLCDVSHRATVTAMHRSADERSATSGTLPERGALTVKAAAAYLSLSERTLWVLLKQEKIRSFKVGVSRRVRVSALDEYMAEQEAQLSEAGVR